MDGDSKRSRAMAFHWVIVRRTRFNEKLTLAFGLSMLAILACFALMHLLRRIGRHQGQSAPQGSKPGLVTRTFR